VRDNRLDARRSVMEKTAHMSSVEFDTVFNTTFSDIVGLLEAVGFQSRPKLFFGDGERAQMFRKTVPDDRSGNAETSFVEFRCCSQHDQISTFCRTETGSAREIRPRCADVLEIRGTSRDRHCTRAVQPVATCRQSPYLHKQAIIIMTQFSL